MSTLNTNGITYDSYTTAQRNALIVNAGTTIYNSDTKTIDIFDGAVWVYGVNENVTSLPNLSTVGVITTGTWQGSTIQTLYTQAQVISVSGTTNRITISGTQQNPIVNISANYIGQTSITTLGTITTGTWNATTIGIAYGGTNSSAPLNNNRIMVSKLGAIVENDIITPNRALISDLNGLPIHSVVTTTELEYLSGVTGPIQTQLNNKLSLTGGTLTGPLYLYADPMAPLEAVTKQYVDSVAQGLDAKPTARVATTGPLPSNIYTNGTLGVGAKLTGSVNGSLGTIDGVSLVVGDFILVKNEANSAYNGLYTVTSLGSASTPYILTRNEFMDSANEFSGAFIPVGNEGLINYNSLWLANPGNTVIVGTTLIPFTQLNGATSLIAGFGITISGNIISISNTYIGQTSITTLGTITTGTWNASVISTVYTQAQVISVSGTTNRISVTGTQQNPIVDISANYIGQTSITTLGTITTGTWNATAIGILYGGTGQTTKTAGFNALSPLTTKGDLITHDGTNNVRLGVGANDTILTADSTTATGLKWATKLKHKAGIVAGTAFSGLPQKYTVTFTTPYANNNYAISVLGEDNVTFTIENKTANGFIINANTIRLLIGNVFWKTCTTGEE